MKVTPCSRKTLAQLPTANIFIQNQIEVNCSAERLFAIFEDEQAWTIWGSSLEKVEWTSPLPFGEGTTRVVTMAGGIIGVEEFVCWQTNKRLAFCFTEASMPNVDAFGEDYRIVELAPNKVRLEWDAAFWPSNRLAIWGFKLFSPVMKLLLNSFLKKLKVLAESDYQAQSPNPLVAAKAS